MDIIVLILAVFLRGLIAMNDYKTAKGVPFTLSGYFDLKHSLRWLIHLTSSTICFIALPELFHLLTPYYEGIEKFTIIMTAIVGFAGYDLIKFVEKLVKKKANVNDENNDGGGDSDSDLKKNENI
jgi:hypothetical protein